MKLLKIILLFSILPVHGFSIIDGQSTGNGGDVVVCSTNDVIESVELLDLYESRESNRGFDVNLNSASSVTSKVELAIFRLERVDPIRASRYLQYLSTFFKEADFKDVRLVDIPDSGHLFYPYGCEVEQIAIHREPQYEGQKRYLINERLWNLLDDNNRAALILHEIIYREAVGFGLKNSISSRYFNTWLISSNFELVQSEEYNSFLEIHGLFPGLKYPSIVINKLSKIERYENGQIKKAVVGSDKISSFYYRGENVTLLGGTDISFYENGLIKSFETKKPFKVSVLDNEMMITKKISIFADGSVGSGYVDSSVMVDVYGHKLEIQRSFELYAEKKWKSIVFKGYHNINVQGKSVPFAGNLVFSKNGSLIMAGHIKRGEFLSTIYGDFKFSYETHFYSDGVIEKGHLDKGVYVDLFGQNILFEGGGYYPIEFYPSGKVKSFYTFSQYHGYFVGEDVISKVGRYYYDGAWNSGKVVLTESGEIIEGRISQDFD